MEFTKQSCEEFIEALASKEPVPGGGGASALVGAVGMALGSMVGNLTVGKEKYAGVERDIRLLMAEAGDIQKKLLGAIDEDAAAFEPLSRAYGIPKDDPDRAEIMEKALRSAALPPLKIMKLCCRAIEIHSELAEKGSVMVVSDAGTGAVLCWGAMYGAALNVRVNTKSMRDREYAEAVDAQVDELMEKYWKIAEATYESVCGRFK